MPSPWRPQHPMSRRDFLRRGGGAALTVPSLAAILAACGETDGGGAGTSAPAERQIARPESPVTLPVNAEPIPADAPIEDDGAPLLVFNWDAYIYKKVIKDFEKEYGVKVEYATFNNMEEGIQKLTSGQVKPDVFFPTIDYIGRLASGGYLQPLQQSLLPNMEANVWKAFWDPGPWYDVGWQYTVPYTIYTTAVGYRRDRVDDATAAELGYDLLWSPEYADKISYYDSQRDALGMALLRNGHTDPNENDPALLEEAADSVLQIINDLGGRLTVNGAFAKIPEGEFTVAQAWSGDMVGARWYLPKDTDEAVLGYWFPEDNKGLISNDTIAIPTGAAHPRLAHEFINFFLDEQHGFENFSDWNGYQPPFTTIQPDTLVADGVVPEGVKAAVVTEEMFTVGYTQGELSAEDEAVWNTAWARVQAGG